MSLHKQTIPPSIELTAAVKPPSYFLTSAIQTGKPTTTPGLTPLKKQITTMESTSNNYERNCVLCCQELDIFALGKCDHPVCYRCSTKMRVLCDQKYCAVCREQLDKVTPTTGPTTLQRGCAGNTVGRGICSATFLMISHGLLSNYFS